MRTQPFYFYLIYYRNGDRPVAVLAEKKDGKFTFLQMKTFIILREMYRMHVLNIFILMTIS